MSLTAAPSPVVFYEDRAPGEAAWLCCQGLVEVLQARRPEEVIPVLAAVERAAQEGLYAAGFVAYEAAPRMDEACSTHPLAGLPLAWFGLFREMVRHEPANINPGGRFDIGDWRPSVTLAQYDDAIDRIKRYIARGDTYQVNYTFRLRSPFRGDAWAFFRRLCRAQQARYGAFLDIGSHVICSASPELFFRLDGQLVTSRPMKGTSRRGLTFQEDERFRSALGCSVKDRAENAMVVDMVRNDIGRIARWGSVRVDSAFDLEKYPTLFQMTSTVTGETSASFVSIVQALFPAASITGAPKIRSMQIIRELEPDARGVYTGCIGYLAPRRRARFSVAIRTVAIDRAARRAEYGVGGGIVWDSTTEGEYAECCTKAAVLTAEIPQFELLETLLYENGKGWFLLPRHLRRLSQSAAYFDFAIDLDAIQRQLQDLAGSLPAGSQRVRLRVRRRGQAALEAAPLSSLKLPAPLRLILADKPIDAGNLFLYHKTTCRDVYDSAFSSRGDCDDAVLWNSQGHVTETTIANLVVEKCGRLVTPPVACGLLPGLFREHLLETGEIVEDVVTIEDLRRAPRVFAINSVRRWMPAVLQP